MKKVLLLPGWMEHLEIFNNRDDIFDIQTNKLSSSYAETDYIIGFSLGVLAILQNIDIIKSNIILINPPLPKRNILTWFLKWLKFILSEGLSSKRQKFITSPIKFFLEIINCIKLLNMDTSKIFNRLPKDKITVICGKNDNYFCDDVAVEFLRSNNINLIEIDGGHNWCEEIENQLISIMDNKYNICK